jgi:hypothetical protein
MTARDGPHGLLTLVCITCGLERYFSDPPPERVQCTRCAGTVFRNYFTPTEPDEATQDQLQSTARSLSWDDEVRSVSDDELRDLDGHT